MKARDAGVEVVKSLFFSFMIVFAIFDYSYEASQLLVEARKQGMFDGKYVFITMDFKVSEVIEEWKVNDNAYMGSYKSSRLRPPDRNANWLARRTDLARQRPRQSEATRHRLHRVRRRESS